MPDSPATPPDSSDAALLRAAARGDLRAFETIYLRHRTFVWRIARRYAGDAAALDIAQDAFLHLLEKAGSLALTGKLTTYLYPVVKNLALARRRNDARRSEILRAAATRIAPPPAAQLSTHTDSNNDPMLASALASLGEEHREVLLMRIVDEMSVEEVAFALGIPAGTVKSRLHHALEKMREAERPEA